MGLHNEIPSYGWIIVDSDFTLSNGNVAKILYTGDAKVFEDHDLYEKVDLIIHDCETHEFSSGVHAHYNELRLLPPDIKRKMLFIHYGDNAMNNDEWNKKAESDGFPMIGLNRGLIHRDLKWASQN